MKRIFLSSILGLLTSGLIFALLNCAGNAEKSTATLQKENEDTWISYWNKDSTLIGFKDKNGVIKTEPKFGAPDENQVVYPRKFDNIIAIGEEVAGKWDAYYLAKSGKAFGRDSIYFTDEAEDDCESEGFIRFMKMETKDNGVNYKYIGMFNRNGDVVAPAKYNYLSKVMNGMITTLEGAKKECLDRYCEHYKFVGGRKMLIDTLNNVLADNFSFNERTLDIFSMQKTATPHPDTIRESFLAIDGSYYSFINFEKEFEQWLKYDLLANLTLEKLLNVSFEMVRIESAEEGQSDVCDTQLFIINNFEILKKGLLAILDSNNEHYIITETLNRFDRIDFEGYFDSCGDSKKQYPVMEVVISNQSSYDFLRTDSGYKLIYVYFKNETLKL